MVYVATISDIDDKIQEAINEYDASFQPTTIVVGAHPKKKHENKFIQWLLIKVFGYELEYKTVMAKTVVLKAEDCPTALSGEFTFTIGKENPND